MSTVVTPRAPGKRQTATIAGTIEAPPRRRGRPPRLSRPAILGKALELVDEEGIEALTMRRLGSELGVEAMSLYRHVSSKRALLDGIAEQLMTEVDGSQEPSGGAWPEAARGLAFGIRAVARAHPAAFELVGLRALHTHHAQRAVEALLADLRAGGFAPDRAVAVYRLLASYARGFALIEIAGDTPASTGADHSRAPGGERTTADEFPTIRELSRELSHEPTDAHFRAGLETILAGLRQELEAAPTPS